MSKNELQTGFNGLLNTIQSQIEDDDITEVSYKINKKKGIMSISGKKNNEAFRATKQIYGDSGSVQSASRFNANIDRTDRVRIVKDMYRKGFKQQEIADTLGISQAQVSNIINS